MLNIHDIKPLVPIPDYSIYFYYGFITLIIALLIICCYLIYKWIQKRKNNQLKLYYQELQHLCFDDPKKAAYKITTYGRLLAKEQRSKKLIEELWEELQPYKYKKDVPKKLSKEIQAKFTIFMDSIDV